MRNIEEIKEYINECVKSNNFQKILERNFIKNKEQYFIDIVNNFILNKSTDKWIHKLYNYMNLLTIPTCKVCTKETKFITYKDGYRIYCSTRCIQLDPDTKDKIQKTNLHRYGVNNAMSSDIIQNKIKSNNLKKYGVESTNMLTDVKNKIKQTNLDRYGVENILQLNENKEKIKKTNLERYGVEWVTQRKDIKQKIKCTNIKRFGTKTPIENDDIKNKILQTTFEKYGNICYLASDEFKKKNKIQKEIKLLDTINNYLIKDNLIFNKYDKKINTITYNCNICNSQEDIKYQTLYLRHKQNKTICIICNPLFNVDLSVPEKNIRTFIEENYTGEIIYNDRLLITPYEIDIYLPEINLAIEFNGTYWHSEYFKSSTYHQMKHKKCLKKNIQLIQIWEDDWEYKQDIIKSIILNKLNKSTKIFARKCIIKNVENKESSIFLKNNHLQGSIGAQYKLGLYYNDELVSLMTFGSRFNKFELLRFCNKLNISVVGGASKLFKHFINNYQFENLISYCNLDHGNGNLYKQLGFTYIKDTKPNYWWVIDNIRNYRYKYRISELLKKNIALENQTEVDCMHGLGYYRIYDTGSQLWNYKK